MYQSGIIFFPEPLHHDECYLINARGEKETQIAFGWVELKTEMQLMEPNDSCDPEHCFVLSTTTKGFPDWIVRYKRSGFDAEKKEYPFGSVFMFPFKAFKDFGIRGEVYNVNQRMTSFHELVDTLKA